MDNNYQDSHNYSSHINMAKSKLLTAFDAQVGRDYKLEKQKKLQKQAAKKRKSKAQASDTEEKENAQLHISANTPILEAVSEGYESDESEVAEMTAVC